MLLLLLVSHINECMNIRRNILQITCALAAVKSKVWFHTNAFLIPLAHTCCLDSAQNRFLGSDGRLLGRGPGPACWWSWCGLLTPSTVDCMCRASSHNPVQFPRSPGLACSDQPTLSYSCAPFFVVVLKILFIYSWETGRERDRDTGMTEKQAPCQECDMGLDPGSPGSDPGLKVAFNHWATRAAQRVTA